jgi:hypothetical protein
MLRGRVTYEPVHGILDLFGSEEEGIRFPVMEIGGHGSLPFLGSGRRASAGWDTQVWLLSSPPLLLSCSACSRFCGGRRRRRRFFLFFFVLKAARIAQHNRVVSQRARAMAREQKQKQKQRRSRRSRRRRRRKTTFVILGKFVCRGKSKKSYKS